MVLNSTPLYAIDPNANGRAAASNPVRPHPIVVESVTWMVKVYVPAVLISKLENVAIPPLSVTVPVLAGVNEVCVLPLLIVIVTDPFAVVTKLP